MSTAGEAHRFCHMFEAELLLELMLRYWHHPLADDAEYRNNIIEHATSVLKDSSSKGKVYIKELPPEQMNFVAAVWYVEWSMAQDAGRIMDENIIQLREKWLNAVRHAIPSCFCDQDYL